MKVDQKGQDQTGDRQSAAIAQAKDYSQWLKAATGKRKKGKKTLQPQF